MIITYNNKKYYYGEIFFMTCCGAGNYSYVQLKNEEDMNYFNHKKIEYDEQMQKHFEYLLTNDY